MATATKTPKSVTPTPVTGSSGTMSTAGSANKNNPTTTPNLGNNMSTVAIGGTQPGSLMDFLNKSSSLSRPSFWQRIGVFLLGVALVWVGILILIASNKTVQNAAKGAIGGAISKTPAGVATNLATGALA